MSERMTADLVGNALVIALWNSGMPKGVKAGGDLYTQLRRQGKKYDKLRNGKEFYYNEKICKVLSAAFYFAHPYSSWERRLNENTYGLLRHCRNSAEIQDTHQIVIDYRSIGQHQLGYTESTMT
jgi:IS30 family transposase